MQINIIPVRAFTDNYIWMLVDDRAHTAWVVDPGEAPGVLSALKQFNLQLQGILLTHHHNDHCGGVVELLRHYPDSAVCGSHRSPHPYLTQHVKDHQTVNRLPWPCRVLEIPGHTLDHVAYSVGNVLFCGDTLFSVGCGKIFEGTPAQMYHSLLKLQQLDDPTQIYCGHEYTLANLNFARNVDPHNAYLINKLTQVQAITQQHGCTLPTTLSEEKKINPFLRCTTPEIIAAVENHAGKKLDDPVDIFHTLREWKNNYRAIS